MLGEKGSAPVFTMGTRSIRKKKARSRFKPRKGEGFTKEFLKVCQAHATKGFLYTSLDTVLKALPQELRTMRKTSLPKALQAVDQENKATNSPRRFLRIFRPLHGSSAQ
jgi:hypothetical protein